MVDVNFLLIGFLLVFLAQTVLGLCLERFNIEHLAHGKNRVPPSFEGFVDAARLARINTYTFHKSRLTIVSSLTADFLLLMLILSGFMPALEWFLGHESVPAMPARLLFFLLPGLILYLFELPFDYYEAFIIEEQFGFNRSTLGTWVTDHIKSAFVSMVLLAMVLLLIFWTIDMSPRYWWLWGFLLVSLVQISLVMLYPVVIAPLFNELTPLQDEQLAAKIRHLMEENGIKVKRILQMNETLRSRHTNAYFAGLGKTRQIVLFDTLLQSHPHAEVLAVLAHEAGHIKRRHILKQLLLFEGAMLIGFYLTFQLMRWPLLYAAFGFQTAAPCVGLFFIVIFWQKAGFFFKPVYMALSRRFEREADAFAVTMLGDPQPLATALKRMAADNLANLAPHPLYVKFNYSHPPFVERVAAIQDEQRAGGSCGMHRQEIRP